MLQERNELVKLYSFMHLKTIGDVKSMTTLSTLFFVLFMWFPCFSFSSQTYQKVELPSGVVGAESFAFDCNGEGPYTGVSDGRILKWQGDGRGWSEFAVTSPSRKKDLCDGSSDPNLEPTCGRPLGLQFNKVTCELFIADAYFGLMKVGKNGGTAMQLASSAEGVPFKFTNSLDIDQKTGVVYFTDSSTKYQRRDNKKVFESGDNTSRFMKYDPSSKQVKVLLRGLYFANGVAISNDNSYVVVAETSKYRVIRYWLQEQSGRKSEIFTTVQGPPDNVKRNDKGEYLVALNYGTTSETIGVRVNGEGKVVETFHAGNEVMVAVSEVAENKGRLLVGSVEMPCVYFSTL